MSEQFNWQKTFQALFSPNVVKLVNSKLICQNQAQLLEQMLDVKNTYGIYTIVPLEIIVSGQSTVIHWELTYTDGDPSEVIISILKANDKDEIVEINEVFGEKDVYQWQSRKKSMRQEVSS